MAKPAKSPTLTVYDLSGNKITRLENEIQTVSQQPLVVDSGRIAFLRGNPFFYNSKTSPYPVTSLEDYIIKVGKEEIAFGDTLRNPRFSPRKRKRIVKKTFKNWDLDYRTQKNTAFKQSDKTVEVIGGIDFLKFTWKMRLLIGVLFALLLFLVIPTSSLWERFAATKAGAFLRLALISGFAKTPWVKGVGNLTIYLLLSLTIYASIFNRISAEFSRNYQMALDYLNKSERIISGQYRKKFRKAYKYYLDSINNARRPYFAPLDIRVIEEGDLNITTFNSICQATVDRAYVVKKGKPYYIAIKNGLLFCGLGGSALVVGYSLYQIVLNLF